MNDTDAQDLAQHTQELMKSTDTEQEAIMHQCETIKALLNLMKPKFTAAEWAVYLMVMQKQLAGIIKSVAEPEGTKDYGKTV